jgi:hypothetical protein
VRSSSLQLPAPLFRCGIFMCDACCIERLWHVQVCCRAYGRCDGLLQVRIPFSMCHKCWVTVVADVNDDSLGCGSSWIYRIWWQFGVNRSITLNKLKLSTALQTINTSMSPQVSRWSKYFSLAAAFLYRMLWGTALESSLNGFRIICSRKHRAACGWIQKA